MSLRLVFLDSFDHYGADQAYRKWTSASFTLVSARTNNGALIGGFGSCSRTLEGEYSSASAGVAYKTEGFSNSPLALVNAVNGLACRATHIGDGRFRVVINAGGIDGAGSPSVLAMHTNRWYYLELTSFVSISDNGDGTSDVTVGGWFYVNEVLWCEHSKTDTVPSGDAHGIAALTVGGPGGGQNALIDDVYVTADDDFGLSTIERLGDVRVGVLYPNAAGDLTEWTPNGAGANYLKTQEHPADDDTTYVASDTAGERDLYNLDDISPSFSGVIKGAQALWLVRKSDGGLGKFKGVWKSAGTTVEGTEYAPSYLDYLYDIQPERKSLFTLADWGIAEINALQLGGKRTA